MPAIVICPRCQRRLSVPSKKAESYVLCPKCQGRLWVPADGNGRALERLPWPERGDAVDSADTADARNHPSPGGRLPELHLSESKSPVAKQRTAVGTNPAVIIAVLCISTVATVGLLFMPMDTVESARNRETDRAWSAIERDFFADADGSPHHFHQFALRAALRVVHLRGDEPREREFCRQVS